MFKRFFFGGAMLAVAGGASAQQYNLIDLGGFPTPTGLAPSFANASNIGMQATGSSAINAGDTQAFFYSQQTGMVNIGNFAGVPNGVSEGNAINASGTVVGAGTASDGFEHGFTWTQAGGMKDIGKLAGGSGSVARGINNAGTVVGDSDTATSPGEAVTWTQAGGLVDMGGIQGTNKYSYATCINSNGQIGGGSLVAGTFGHAGAFAHGFVFTPGHGFAEIGDFNGGDDSGVTAINSQGNAVGFANGAGRNAQPFFWSPTGGEVNLGQLPGGLSSEAFGLNDSNVVTGWGFVSGIGDKGWVWDQTNGMRSLDSLLAGNLAANWDVTVTGGVDNNGVIVGQAFDFQHQVTHGVLLVPVPEPSPLVFLAIGIPAIVGLRRRRS
jgi:probable HAF family extracellular repeat protein